MLWWVSVAPLGEPVVPDVYWMLIASSNCSQASRSASSSSPTRSPSARNASQSSSSTIASRSSGQAPRTSASMRHVVGLAEAAGEDEHAHAGLLQRVGELARLVGRVDRDEDRADARGRELRHDPLVAVGRPDADALTHADAVREQCARRDVDLIPELVVGRAVALVGDDECLALGRSCATVLRRHSPIVSPSSGSVLGPCAYEGACNGTA